MSSVLFNHEGVGIYGAGEDQTKITLICDDGPGSSSYCCILDIRVVSGFSHCRPGRIHYFLHWFCHETSGCPLLASWILTLFSTPFETASARNKLLMISHLYVAFYCGDRIWWQNVNLVTTRWTSFQNAIRLITCLLFRSLSLLWYDGQWVRVFI